MRVAIYGRVSTGHQVEHQTIEQQIERLTAHVAADATEGWTLDRPTSSVTTATAAPRWPARAPTGCATRVKGRELDRVLVTAPRVSQ
jgi:hypothetical protein